MSLDIQYVIHSENEIKINPIGEVDIYTSPQLKNLVIELIEKEKLNITIDGERLDYIDSTGLGVLMGIYKKTVELKINLKIINLKPNIYKLFDITGLNKVFNIEA